MKSHTSNRYESHIAHRRAVVATNIRSERIRSGNRDHNLRIGSSLFAVGLIGFASVALYNAATDEPDFNPNTITYVVQPGDTINNIADLACENTSTGVVVDFILDKNHISEDQIGNLQAGAPLTVPDPADC